MSQTNRELFDRATRVIPGGVNSPVRAFDAVGGTPYFVTKAEGPYVWDADDKRYIDFVQSYGAIILGHANPAVIDAVERAARLGTSYGAPTENEVRLAELLVESVPSIDKVRLVSSGTEATMTAVRIARGFTERNTLVKFAGCYHGHSDGLLAAGGSGIATLGLPSSAGVTTGQVAETVVVEYNVVPSLDEQTACVIVEPVAANMGLIPPAPGFLEGLRAECDRVGALLIFDEVITGFRLGLGGAQARYGVMPDLTTLGKVIGGGLPVGAVGGRSDVMNVLAPLGPVYQAGTLSGNPLATAAGLATLAQLDADVYDSLQSRVQQLASGLQDVFANAGFNVHVPVVGTLIGLFFGETAPVNFDDAKRTDEKIYASVFHELLTRGVAVAPGPYEVLFCGLAHSGDVLDSVLERAADAADAVAAKL